MSRLSFLILIFCFSLQGAFAKDQVAGLVHNAEYDKAVESSLYQNNDYLSELIRITRELDLANDTVWLALGHYKKGFLGQIESQVDGADFFLSKNGKYSPASEIEATLAAFFSDLKREPNKLSIQCRFIARFHWLNKKLSFDTSRLDVEVCSDFDLYMGILDPDKLTVVFPTTHPNSPSSMFGHTLLRVDKKAQTEQTKMLNYSINYAAHIQQNTSPFLYSLLGLSGGFPGKFSIVPYYTKLREYAQMENRDVWEYTLNLSHEQITFILMHVYELSPSYFDYYFFTENCSYHLLSLLDVAFPDAPFTNHFNGWTIPVDTLRLLRSKNLVSEVKYYPSHARKIKAKQKAMLQTDVSFVRAVFLEGLEKHSATIEGLSEDRQIQVLDLLNDYYRFNKLKLSEHSATKLNKLERGVLLMRSKIKQPSLPVDIEAPSIQPDFGHGSSKVSLGASKLSDDNSLFIKWRPAYHDLLDPSAGFSSNSSLEFMDVKLVYHLSQDKLRISSVKVLEILSLEPRDDFFSNVSWRLSMGWKKQAEVNLTNVSYVAGGGGFSYSLSDKSDALIYGLLGGAFQYAGASNGMLRVAPTLRLGLVGEVVSRWRVHAYAESLKGFYDDLSQLNLLVFEQSFAVSKNLSIRVGAQRGYKDNLRWSEYDFGVDYYF